MITMHHEKETDFSKNGYGAIDNYVINQEVFWEMNGQFYAYLEYPAFLDKADYLVNKNILRIPVPFMDDQLFRIYRTRKVLGFIQVEARHIFYDLMDNLIEDTNIVGKNGSQAVQQLLSATQYGHRFTGLSDITTTNNARMVRYNPVEALLDDTQSNTFVSRWGGEVVRDNFMIRMAKQMGSDRGVHIQHKKDLLGYEATIDESTVVTRIMPIGFDGLKLPELYIDSPLIDLSNPKIRVIKYDDAKAATGMYAEDEDAIPVTEAYALLRKYAKEEFSVNHLDEPETTVKVNFASLHNTKEYEEFSQLQEIKQGDVVKVSVPEEGFEITSRLIAFTSDPLRLNHYTSTTLGNHVFEFTSSSNDTTMVRNEVEQLRESVITAMQSANGKNRNFWGTADPNTLSLNASVGDNYFRENGEETTLYQYVELNGERYWKEIIDTSKVSIVAGKVEEAMAEAEQAKEEAQNAYADSIAEAERLVGEQTTAFDTKFGEIEDSVDAINQSVSDADAKAEAIKQGLGLADPTLTNQQITDQIRQEFNSLKSTADTASQAFIDLNSEYQTFLTDRFDPALTKATNALSLAQQNEGLFYSANLIDEVTGLSNVYTKAEIDGTNGYVTKATFNANAESLSSEFERIEGVALASGANINLLVVKNAMNNTWLDANPETRVYPTPNDTTNNIATSPDLISVTAGEKITLSKTAVPTDNYFRIDYLDADKKHVKRYTQNANVATITIPENVAYMWVSYPMDSYPKIERGEEKTQWTLAPQDQVNQSSLNYLTSKIEQTPGMITEALTSYTKTDNLDNTVASYITNTTTNTAGAITTKLSEYQTTSGLDGSVASILDNTTSQTASKINSKLTDIEAQIPTAIGGRNLLRGTADFDTYFWRNVSTVMPSTRDSRYKQVRVDGDFNVAPITTMSVQGWNFEIGEEYVISVWAKSEQLGNKLGVTAQSIPYFEPQVVTLSKWSRYTWTFTATISSLANFRFETRNGERVWITQPKIEKGSVPTDWTSAVEDLATVVQTNEIERTANYTKSAITNVTKDGLVTGSTINQTNDGITERVARLDTNGNVSYTNRDVKLDSIVSTVANASYISNIIQASDLVQSTIRENTNVDLLARSASGTSMTDDPHFNKSINGLIVYDNANTNTISIYRNLNDDPNLPGGKGHRLDIYHAISTTTSPYRGGVVLPTRSWANGVVVVRFTAKLDVGRSFVYAQDQIGTGSTHGWLTDNKGTGKWEQYAYYYRFGSTGTFGAFGFLAVDGTSSAFTWRLSEFDIINLGMSTQSQITQLQDNINLKVSEGDLINQINISAGGTLIQSGTNKLNVTPTTTYIENSTIKSAMIDTLNVSKLTGTVADFTSLRSKVITADSISATHIKSDIALIDTIFATSALIERLTSKTAFINSIKAMEIDAGKITTGELNAANVSIVNLDVNKLTGNVVNFISGAFTSNAGSLLLSGNGIRVNFSNGYNLRINGAGTNYYTSGGQPIGGLLTTLPIGGAAHSLSLNARRGYTVSMGYQGSLSYNQSNRALEVDGTTGNITIERPIYESSGSAGLEFTRADMGNVGWGLLLASTKATGSGIFLADNGEVWLGIPGGYKQFA